MNIFSANVKNIKNFKQLLSIIKDINIDIEMIMTKEGINITSFDNVKSILFHGELCRDNFIDYTCIVDKFIVTMGSHSLYKIVNKISNKASLNICVRNEDYIDNQCRFLTLIVDHSIIKIKLNENNIELALPELEKRHKTTFSMKSNELLYVVKYMENISDVVELYVNFDQVKFSCLGQYAESEISFANHIQSIQCDKIQIPISLLKLFTKSLDSIEPVQISFGNGVPFSLFYKIVDIGFIQFFYKNAQTI